MPLLDSGWVFRLCHDPGVMRQTVSFTGSQRGLSLVSFYTEQGFDRCRLALDYPSRACCGGHLPADRDGDSSGVADTAATGA